MIAQWRVLPYIHGAAIRLITNRIQALPFKKAPTCLGIAMRRSAIRVWQAFESPCASSTTESSSFSCILMRVQFANEMA
jgi:hypothetical protein